MGTHHWEFLMLPFESGEQAQCITFRGRLGIVDPVTNHQSIVALPAASRPGGQFDERIGRDMRFQCFSQGDFPEGADAVPGKPGLYFFWYHDPVCVFEVSAVCITSRISAGLNDSRSVRGKWRGMMVNGPVQCFACPSSQYNVSKDFRRDSSTMG